MNWLSKKCVLLFIAIMISGCAAKNSYYTPLADGSFEIVALGNSLVTDEELVSIIKANAEELCMSTLFYLYGPKTALETKQGVGDYGPQVVRELTNKVYCIDS